MADYIVCSECGCVHGKSDSVSAIYDGWVWRTLKWFCPKCKGEWYGNKYRGLEKWKNYGLHDLY